MQSAPASHIHEKSARCELPCAPKRCLKAFI
jgi:hypothetical protein